MDTRTIEAGNWWAQSRGTQAGHWIGVYQNSLHAAHRTAIVNQVKATGATTLLEVGCHCGPNLMRLAQECPDLQMIGVDISAEAIAAGRAWMQRSGFGDRVQLNAGRVPLVTEALPTGAFDVVLSCYALAYIAPADLPGVLYEMGRLAAKAVILAEPMPINGAMPDKRTLTGYSEWAHDYVEAGRWVGTWRDLRPTVTPIHPPIDRLNGLLVAAR